MTRSEHADRPSGPGLNVFLIAINYLTIGQLALGAVVVACLGSSATAAIAIALAWLYLLPPVVCRLTLGLFGRPAGRGITQSNRAFKVWWFLTQWQNVFNRLPLFDELLRLVPGLYPLWLNAWGGHVSLFSYWAPGARILDRYLVHIETGAVIGVGAGLSGHSVVLDAHGAYRVDIAAPFVGAGAVMGVQSGLGPGSALAAGTLLPARRFVRPYRRWPARPAARVDHEVGADDE